MYTIVELSPEVTYQTRQKALRAVERKFRHLKADQELFKVALLRDEEGGWFPVIVDIHVSNPAAYPAAIASGLHLIN